MQLLIRDTQLTSPEVTIHKVRQVLSRCSENVDSIDSSVVVGTVATGSTLKMRNDLQEKWDVWIDRRAIVQDHGCPYTHRSHEKCPHNPSGL